MVHWLVFEFECLISLLQWLHTLNKSLHKAHCGWQTMSILILTHI